jgi:hypothetical protein
VFREMPLLRTLRLDSNRLGVSDGLPDMAFRGIEFDFLDLASNDLSAIPDALFDGVKRVTSLRLDDNQLETLNRTCLVPIRDSLRSLSVAGNRRPLTVANDAIDGIVLSVLDVRRSGLRSIEFLENVGSVELLDVGGNPLDTIVLKWASGLALSCRQVRLDGIGLTKVDAALLDIFRSAVEIDLSDNPIVTVDPEEFRGRVVSLRRLDLSNTSLTTISIWRLVERLSQLETLNLSYNALTDIGSPPSPTSDSAAGGLRVLDVAHNRIQILAASLESVFDRLNVIRLAGNPIHCNCESTWLRRWIVARVRKQGEQRKSAEGGSVSNDGAAVDDVDSVRCASPPQAAASTAPLADLDAALFACRLPTIVAQTKNIAVAEDATVVLSCTADGDPAPDVHWSSPIGEVLGVTPPADRRQNRSTAVWSTRRIRRKDAGWYICNASSAIQASTTTGDVVINAGDGGGAGSRFGYTYVHVVVPDEPPIQLLDELKYPALPSPATSPSPTTTRSSGFGKSSGIVARINVSSVATNTTAFDLQGRPTHVIIAIVVGVAVAILFLVLVIVFLVSKFSQKRGVTGEPNTTLQLMSAE